MTGYYAAMANRGKAKPKTTRMVTVVGGFWVIIDLKTDRITRVHDHVPADLVGKTEADFRAWRQAEFNNWRQN